MKKNVTPYQDPEQQPSVAAEPAALYGDINSMKETLINRIRTIDNIEEVNRLLYDTDFLDANSAFNDEPTPEELRLREEAYYRAHPLRPYTMEELNRRIDESMEDVRAGRVYSIEEMRKMHPRIPLA